MEYDLDFLGVSLGNYGATAVLGALIAQYGGGLLLGEAMLSSTFGFLAVLAVCVAAVNAVYYMYRKKNNDRFDRNTEIGLALAPIIITPLGAILIGVVLWGVGKLR